jgi:uncharacterized protein YigE (DUF2233 family)
LRVRKKAAITGALIGLAGLALAACDLALPREGGDHCRSITHESTSYTVCTFRADRDDIRLFHSTAGGTPYSQFDALADALAGQGDSLVFAMNGGMYHDTREPVGYLRTANGDKASVNTNEGPGNFHMKPNGVFWLNGGRAGVTVSEDYLADGIDPDFATQSGPMLVIEGDIHPSINADGTSRKRRNGVGVGKNGRTVHFAISDSLVTFHEFASLFRDRLDAPDALFLDGQVSRLYAPGMGRDEPGMDMGPIVGVVE